VAIFRVIVRGRFGPLDAEHRTGLLAAAGEHDLLTSAPLFTATGTLSYDRRADFFSYRIEVRVDEHEPGASRAAALERAVAVATADLERRGLPWRDLRTEGVDMASVWD
jgi:hypothetical protein